jgi:hypothetical protein
VKRTISLGDTKEKYESDSEGIVAGIVLLGKDCNKGEDGAW